jgi:hypothetical protein
MPYTAPAGVSIRLSIRLSIGRRPVRTELGQFVTQRRREGNQVGSRDHDAYGSVRM